MHGRNPFTAINNLSFVRNAHHFSQKRPPSRSCSGGSKYQNYQGSYLRDSYLNNWEKRRNQEVLASRLMGIEALRYQAETVRQLHEEPMGTITPSYQSKKEYYNLQTVATPSPSLPIRSNFQGSTTRDMFGSQYFCNKFNQQISPNADSVRQMDTLPAKKPSLFKKAISNGNGASRFRVTQQQLDSFISQTQNQMSRKTTIRNEKGDPETLYLKSRNTTFYLYRNPNDSDSQ